MTELNEQNESETDYLISATIAHHHKHGAMLQSDSILYLDPDPVIYLLADSCHFPPVRETTHNYVNTKNQVSDTLRNKL